MRETGFVARNQFEPHPPTSTYHWGQAPAIVFYSDTLKNFKFRLLLFYPYCHTNDTDFFASTGSATVLGHTESTDLHFLVEISTFFLVLKVLASFQ